MTDPLSAELARLRGKGDNDSLIEATHLERDHERNHGTPEQRQWWKDNGDDVDPEVTPEQVDPALRDAAAARAQDAERSGNVSFSTNPLGDDNADNPSGDGDADNPEGQR